MDKRCHKSISIYTIKFDVVSFPFHIFCLRQISRKIGITNCVAEMVKTTKKYFLQLFWKFVKLSYQIQINLQLRSLSTSQSPKWLVKRASQGSQTRLLTRSILWFILLHWLISPIFQQDFYYFIFTKHKKLTSVHSSKLIDSHCPIPKYYIYV